MIQGPMSQTVPDFWRLVWEQRVRVVVMITNIVEQGKKKCSQYWPETGWETYGLVSVTLLEESVQVNLQLLPLIISLSTNWSSSTNMMEIGNIYYLQISEPFIKSSSASDFYSYLSPKLQHLCSQRISALWHEGGIFPRLYTNKEEQFMSPQI